MFAAIGSLMGGLGLFLIGMMQLTDGLKHSAGAKLEQILNQWTCSKPRAFGAGFLLTGLVQSSSVVTVATIGFVNASLLSMSQAMWVVFGSNVGTTMTAWIVALIGFKVKVDVIALPMVGVGAFINILMPNPRWKAFGSALAGFGMLFVGLGLLQSGLSDYGSRFTVLDARDFDVYHTLLMIGAGFLMTAVMQSSSAAMAVILTLVNAQVVPLSLGAAAVIGSNIGTTSTALLATIGATANAKRVAWAHVVFNVFAAAGALLLLPLVSELFTDAYQRELMGGNAAFWLAVYHTLFNLFGVAMMIPLEPRITAFLQARFSAHEHKRHKLKFLDKNVLTMPPVAMQAAVNELLSFLTKTVEVLRETQSKAAFHEEITEFRNLLNDFDDAVVRVLRQPMAESSASLFSDALRCSQGIRGILDLVVIDKEHLTRQWAPEFESVAKGSIVAFNAMLEAVTQPQQFAEVNSALEICEQSFKETNGGLFQLIRAAKLPEVDAEFALQWLTNRKRLARQLRKTSGRLFDLGNAMHQPEAEKEDGPDLVDAQ